MASHTSEAATSDTDPSPPSSPTASDISTSSPSLSTPSSSPSFSDISSPFSTPPSSPDLLQAAIPSTAFKLEEEAELHQKRRDSVTANEKLSDDLLDFNMEMLNVFDRLSTDDLSLSDVVVRRINKQRQKLLRVLEERTARIKRDMEKAPFIKLKDKWSFVIGVANVALTAFILGARPDMMPMFFTVKAIILLTLRWILWRQRRWHYFLFDFCYYANILILIYLHVFPKSQALFIICFAFSIGPLAWAILTWRNSLVFHSLDKTTSLFIHLTPNILMYSMRWLANDPYSLETYETCRTCDVSFFQMMAYPVVPYVIWQILYFVKVQILSAKKVQERDYQTSFRWFREKDKGRVGRIIQRRSVQYQLATYIGYQFLYTVITLLPAYLYLNSFWAHTIFLGAMGTLSAYNGAEFYFDVFSTRYAESLQKGSERILQLRRASVSIANNEPRAGAVLPKPVVDSDLKAKRDQKDLVAAPHEFDMSVEAIEAEITRLNMLKARKMEIAQKQAGAKKQD